MSELVLMSDDTCPLTKETLEVSKMQKLKYIFLQNATDNNVHRSSEFGSGGFYDASTQERSYSATEDT